MSSKSLSQRPVLMIDNFDSFVYNLVDYIGRLGRYCEIYRNDEIQVQDLDRIKPSHLVISPGPKTPKETGACRDLLLACAGKIPILGVCLGHQLIGETYGAKIVRCPEPKHGKTSYVRYKPDPLLEVLPNPFLVMRYHSLVIEETSVPKELKILAHSQDDQKIMCIKHRKHSIYGVQFHPESIFTPVGLDLLKRFFSLSEPAS